MSPFLLSMLLILALSKLAPAYPITGGYSGVEGYLIRMFWPCIALACSKVTITLKITRQGMVEQMQMPYMMNVEAKGMPRKNMIWKHGLKNAVIVGAVLVESVFSLSGVGSLLIDSIKSSDFPVVQAIILMLVVVFLITGALADFLYAVIDPRIRAGRKG